ncbi:hypothetical protein AZE42_01849 [Rhizopogon vesiculosus]|uniref:Transcription factor TFIIIC triple barrel domain-containing protein n=1 Tax=Rhizopogon vesiculosus TaxID=180088 RepID=A0A1J8PIS4_9AGAM|nr:hypothetical protein AZE42_01849 [Rhizopogon vesiculosus]
MAATSPFAGHRQVDSFGPDEDYLSEEEETVYVTLDLGAVEPTLLSSSSTYRLVGLDTPTPFLQLSGSFFRGRHDTLIGSELLFTERKKDDSEGNTRSLTHVGVTEQRIQFKEVQLREKSREHTGEPTASASVAPTNDAPSQDGGQALGRMIGSITEPARKRKKRPNKEKDTSPQEEGKDDAMDTN